MKRAIKRTNMWKRLCAGLLSVIMCCTMLPFAGAFEADLPEDEGAAEEDVTVTTPIAPENLTIEDELSEDDPDAQGDPPEADDLSLEKEPASEEYTIYPLPREVSYGDMGVPLISDINVVYADAIDQPTRDLLESVLGEYIPGADIEISDASAEGKLNFLIGVIDDGSEADRALADIDRMMPVTAREVTETVDIFGDNDANDAYILRVQDDTVAIVSQQTDAAFYGITTLKHIFMQMQKMGLNRIRELTIRDYASVPSRGFIEGFFGHPWSHEDRISLMEWGGLLKMNTYVFAPKDDPYHNEKWREPYPGEELKKVAELAETGTRTKTQFVFAIHPFMKSRFDFNNYEHDLEVLLNKLEQVYSAGVRQFAVLADDSQGLSPAETVRVLNDVQAWCDDKGDVRRLIHCSAYYNGGTNDTGYQVLSTLDQEMDESVEIFWTGKSVCGHADKEGAKYFLDNVGRLNGGKEPRLPLMWLNWPVNDIDDDALLMGPGSNEGGGQCRGTGSIAFLNQGDADWYSGIISNPMQQAECNKIPLFAVADFAWNDDNYNGQQNWYDSFEYFEEESADVFREIARHLQDTQRNGHSVDCGESENIKELLQAFLSDYKAGNPIRDTGKELVREFDVIINACNALPVVSKNQNLLNEIDPWRKSLLATAEANKGFVNIAIAFEENRTEDVWTYYSNALVQKNTATKCPSPVGQYGTGYAAAGSKRLRPFMNEVSALLAPLVEEVINPSESPEFFYKTETMQIYEGKTANAIDGNKNTYLWLRSPQGIEGIRSGDYVGVHFPVPTDVPYFTILTGKPDGGDPINKGVLEYSTDNGGTYTELPDSAFTSAEKTWYFDTPLKDVTDIRVRITENSTKWLVIREIGVFDEDDPALELADTPVFREGGLRFGGGNEAAYGPDSKIIDGDDSTYAHYSDTSYTGGIVEGNSIGIKLARPAAIGRVRILQGAHDTDGDRMYDAVLEYSLDGENYTTLLSDINQNVIDVDFSNMGITAQYIRLRNGRQIQKWLALRTFSVEGASGGGDDVFTNSPNCKQYRAEIKEKEAKLGPFDNITLQPGEYLGVKLSRIRAICELNALHTGDGLTLMTGMNDLELKKADASDASVSNTIAARYVVLKNETEDPITFDLDELSLKTLEIEPISHSGTLDIYSPGSNPISKLFDGDLNSRVPFNGVQKAGRYAVIGLGQIMTIDSLQFVVQDSDTDYPRHARIELSLTGEDDTWEEIFVIGDEANDTSTMLTDAVGWKHTVSYCYSGSEPTDAPLNIEARYIKMTLLNSIDSYWARLNEIIINSYIQGNSYEPAYRKTENNPTYEGTRETLGHQPGNMFDGDLLSTYYPAESPGSIIYRISEDLSKYNYLSILQNPGTLSGAKVSIRPAGQAGFTAIGNLHYSMNEFDLSTFPTVAEIKIEWYGMIPEIHEIILSKKALAGLDTQALEDTIAAAEDIDLFGYSPEPVEAFRTALDEAKNALENIYLRQSAIDQAARKLSGAMGALLEDKLVAKNPVDLTDAPTGIRLTADAGILPDASELRVVPVTDGGLYDVAQDALTDVATRFMLYDISVWVENACMQPGNGNVKIYIPAPQDFEEENLRICTVDGIGTLTDIPAVFADGKLSFDVDSFDFESAFAIIEAIEYAETPVIIRQPQNQTVTEGGAATFTVEAGAATGILAYQWQILSGEQWSDITGATNAVYTTGAAVRADDGTQYRCAVANTEADKVPVTVYSDAATLTVNRSDTAVVKLSGPKTVHKGESADYLLSIGNLEDLGTMTVTFEVEDKYFVGKQFGGLNGLEQLGDIIWTKQKDGIWRGQATLWSPTGISSEDLMELFQMTFTAKDEAGDTNLTIVGLVLTDYNSGNSRFIDYEFEDGTNSLPIKIGIRYDINGDGVLDQRDLTDAQYYYGAKKGDANWAQAKRADVNGDGVVDAEDFILILMNIQFNIP